MELGGISYKVKVKPEGHMEVKEGGLDLVTLALPGTEQLREYYPCLEQENCREPAAVWVKVLMIQMQHPWC